VRRAALQEQENDCLVLDDAPERGGLGLRGEELRQRQTAEHAESADAEELATVVSLAGASAVRVLDREHDFPRGSGWRRSWSGFGRCSVCDRLASSWAGC